jgi:hypothetical protein
VYYDSSRKNDVPVWMKKKKCDEIEEIITEREISNECLQNVRVNATKIWKAI